MPATEPTSEGAQPFAGGLSVPVTPPVRVNEFRSPLGRWRGCAGGDCGADCDGYNALGTLPGRSWRELVEFADGLSSDLVRRYATIFPLMFP